MPQIDQRGDHHELLASISSASQCEAAATALPFAIALDRVILFESGDSCAAAESLPQCMHETSMPDSSCCNGGRHQGVARAAGMRTLQLSLSDAVAGKGPV